MTKNRLLLSPLSLSLLGLVLITISLSAIGPWSVFWSGGLCDDEDVVFFPTLAVQNVDGSWRLPLHSWVFEREEEDILRILGRRAVAELVEQFGISEQETRSKLFRDRIKYFFVDNQRGKRLKLFISSLKHSAPLEVVLNKTAANGHARTELSYNRDDRDGSWLTYAVEMPKGDLRYFMGQIKLVPPTGLSVICDIDDTIKVSDVLNKRQLLRNVLLRPYRPVMAMSRHLRKLEKKGAYFHYVSASPWQLYPSLKQFLDNYVPRGSVSLRHFRLKDRSFFDFLGSSEKYKIERIKAILERYPQHKFILIGDSGEHDPEVYGRIYHMFPRQIKNITIRKVEGSDTRHQRFLDAFADIPATIWDVRSFAEL
jgi:hypothetical protein